MTEEKTESSGSKPADLAELKAALPSSEELLNAEAKEGVKESGSAKTGEEEPKSIISDMEKEALKQGWTSKDDFKGDIDNWRTAKEYVERGELINRISHQGSDLKSLRKANEQLVDIVKRQSERLANERVDEVLAQKRAAIEEGDVEAAEKYEEKYNQARQEMASFKQEPPGIDPEYKEFIDRNKNWFNDKTAENKAMALYADGIEQELKGSHPEWALTRRLEEVEKTVKTFFRDKFENPNRYRAPSVEGRTIPEKRGPNKITYDDLPDEAKKIVKTMVRVDRTGKMSRDEYAQQLVLTGAVKLGE